MITYLYAVRDRLANSFGALVEYHTDGAAIRDFKRMYAKGVTSDPSQYELHKIAMVSRHDTVDGAAELDVSFCEHSIVYTYTAYVSERLDGNALIDQIALLSDKEIDKVSAFVNSLKEGGDQNGSTQDR